MAYRRSFEPYKRGSTKHWPTGLRGYSARVQDPAGALDLALGTTASSTAQLSAFFSASWAFPVGPRCSYQESRRVQQPR